MFSIFNIVVFIGAICGLAMVIGSMILLWKGSIVLHNANNADCGLSIELLKEIKVTSRNPAVGLFIIGLLFFVVSALFAQKGAIAEFELSGKIKSSTDVSGVEIHLIAGPWKRDVLDSTGVFSEIYYPNVNKLRVKIIAPGYENPENGRVIEIKSGKAVFGPIDIGRRIIKSINVRSNIKPSQNLQDGSSIRLGGQY